jgi:hypothetical protein
LNAPSAEVLSWVEYRLQAVAIGRLALRHSLTWDQVPSVEILFDGKPIIEGRATAFTNGAIEAAIIHARALLEFLGLGGESQTKLREVSSRRRTDLGIEQFPGLSRVSIQRATASYPGPAEEAEASLAYVIHLANKGLAHVTSSFSKHIAGSSLLEVALRGVPALVVNNFYIPLRIKSPEYEPRGRKRVV